MENARQDLLNKIDAHPKSGDPVWQQYKGAIQSNPILTDVVGNIKTKVPNPGIAGWMMGRSEQGKQIQSAHDTLQRAMTANRAQALTNESARLDGIEGETRELKRKQDTREGKKAKKWQNESDIMRATNKQLIENQKKLTEALNAKNKKMSIPEYKKWVKEEEEKKKNNDAIAYARLEDLEDSKQNMKGIMQGGKRKTKCRKRRKRCKTTKRKKSNNKSKRRKMHQKKSTKKRALRRR